jgi:hypothetical protein
MIKNTRKKDAWREYLRGEYSIKDARFENKIRWEIRERAKERMSDLLLICQKASDQDKIMIFKNPKTRRGLVIPLIMALENTSERFNEELENFMDLGNSLLSQGIKFDVPLLIKNPRYRQKKHIELLCKWGLPRKYAKEIATGEAQKRYPTALSPEPLG